MKHILISDIHGCFDEFMELLEAVKYNPDSDVLISCGDLVEKGPKSNDVVSFFRTSKNAISIMGNHEEGLLRFWNHEKKKRENPRYKNPMAQYEDRIKTLNQMEEENLLYLKSLPWQHYFSIRAQNFVAVHGGILPKKRAEDMDPKMLCRLRFIRRRENGKWKMVRMGDEIDSDIFWADLYDGKETAIFGHSPFEEGSPRRFPNAIGIDLGGVYGGHLCAYIPEDDAHISIRVQNAYAKPLMIMKKRP